MVIVKMVVIIYLEVFTFRLKQAERLLPQIKLWYDVIEKLRGYACVCAISAPPSPLMTEAKQVLL
jgi:hypothetical protein